MHWHAWMELERYVSIAMSSLSRTFVIIFRNSNRSKMLRSQNSIYQIQLPGRMWWECNKIEIYTRRLWNALFDDSSIFGSNMNVFNVQSFRVLNWFCFGFHRCHKVYFSSPIVRTRIKKKIHTYNWNWTEDRSPRDRTKISFVFPFYQNIFSFSISTINLLICESIS